MPTHLEEEDYPLTFPASADVFPSLVDLNHYIDAWILNNVHESINSIQDLLLDNHYPSRGFSMKVIADDAAIEVKDGLGFWTVPPEFDGLSILAVGAHIYACSTSGGVQFQIYNVTDSVDILSTVISIDESDYDSKDASAAPVIDSDNRLLSLCDVLRFDCDVAGSDTAGFEIRFSASKV